MTRLLIALSWIIYSSFGLATEPLGYEFADDDFSQSVKTKDWNSVQEYVNRGGDIFWHDKVGNSLLAYLINANQNKLALDLIEKGALTEIETAEDFIDLFKETIHVGNVEIGHILLDRLIDFPFSSESDLLSNLLTSAIAAQEFAYLSNIPEKGYAFISLLLESGADINYIKESRSNLQLALQHKQNPDFFFYLISLGARVNITAEQSALLLFTAALTGKIHVLQYLLAQGISVNTETPQGNTAITGAVQNEGGAVEVTRYLLENGADPCGGNTASLRARMRFLKTDRPDLLERFPQLNCEV